MKVRLLAAAAALTAFAAVSASAAVLVVRSSGPSARGFPAGKALPDSEKLTLKANDVVVLLDSRGTRTLRGPGKLQRRPRPARRAAPRRSPR